MSVTITPQIFYAHVQKLLETWSKKHDHDFDSIIIINGKASVGNQKTVAILSWFLAGYNLADTILFFTKSSIFIYTSQRKINFLAKIGSDQNAKKYNLTFIKKEDDNIAEYKKIWENLHKNISKPKVGLFLNDTKVGAIAEDFQKFIKEQVHDPIEVFNFFNQCFERKTAQQIKNIKRSARVSAYFQQKFIKYIEKVLDDGKRVKHSELTAKITQLMTSQAQLKKIIPKFRQLELQKDYIDVGPTSSIQSGSSIKHKLFAQADQNYLTSDCIILSLGTLYRSYNSYISRTLLIDPTSIQKNIYKKVQTLSKVIIQNLRIGIKLNDVYKIAKKFVQEHLKDLEMPKNLGFGIGVFLRESTLNISQHNDKLIQAGNVFLIDLTFTDIKYQAKTGTKTFGIQIIQTVVVEEKGHQVLTNAVSKSIDDILYQLNGDSDGQNNKKQRVSRPQSQNIIQGGRRRRKNESAQQKLKNQKQRAEHQKQIKQKKLDELRERIHQNFSGDLKKQVMIQTSKLQAYKQRQDLPKDIKKNTIYIDNKCNTILLPVKGAHVPFHIHLLKSIVKSDEGKFASLRFNFHLPNSISNLSFPKFAEPSVFIKEIVFRSTQIARFTQIQKQVKLLQKKIRLQTSEKHAKQDIVEQQKLNLNRGKRPILRDLFPRPTVGQKKTKGSLQCHMNGFRYTSIKGQSIDIAFSNIKFAFFQPCQNQIIAAIHFRLHQPIIVAKKKTEDIQFYSQGGTNAEDVVGRGRGAREDSDDQERQKEARKKIDREFLAWTKACNQFIGNQFTFQMPDRNRGFYGTPFKGNCLIQPTKTCLINITQIPFFVLSISDIEVACFERMYANLRSFDITLVYKDYQNHIRINSIPIKDVQRVKDYLDDHNIIFYDLGKSMNWPKFLAGIRFDFKSFVQNGGWTAWDDQQGQDEQLIQGDSQFSAQSDQLQDSDDSSQSGSGSQKDYDQDDGNESQDDEELSQEGLSWDEMEEKAEKEDKERLRREIQKEKFAPKKKR